MIRNSGNQMAIFALALCMLGLSASVHSEDRVEIDFAPAESSDAVEQELNRHRERPSNYWCDNVSFDGEGIYNLASRIEAGDTELEASFVTVRVGDSDLASYQGTESWISDDKDVAEWVGTTLDSEPYVAHFIVRKNGRADAVMHSKSGSFRLRTTLRPQFFLICRFDPSHPGRNID